MSAVAIHPNANAGLEAKPACGILILHEDLSGYTLAAEVCRRVMDRFGGELEFNIKCWNFVALSDDNCARHAARAASAAEIILLALPSAEVPSEFEVWHAKHLPDGVKSGGALALVLNERGASPVSLERLLLRLHRVAARLGWDFIPLLAGHDAELGALIPAGGLPLAPSPSDFTERAASDHWGLNE